MATGQFYVSTLSYILKMNHSRCEFAGESWLTRGLSQMTVSGLITGIAWVWLFTHGEH